jgi:hypothetical protein
VRSLGLARRFRAAALSAALALLFASAVVAPAHAADPSVGGFDRDSFRAYVSAQGGERAPLMFVYRGTTLDVPSGRVLAVVDGFQIAHATLPDAQGRAYAWRRAFLLYRDATSGVVLRHYPDVRASRTAPPLSITRLALIGDVLEPIALSGVRGGPPRRVVANERLAARRDGRDFVFQRVLTPPNPIEQPVEIMETLVRSSGGTARDRLRMSMTKVANNTDFLPPGGRHVLYMTWRPVERWADVPESLRQFVDTEAPGMKTLPATLADALAELGLDSLAAFDNP